MADRNVKIRLSADRLTSGLMSDMNFGDELGHDVMIYWVLIQRLTSEILGCDVEA